MIDTLDLDKILLKMNKDLALSHEPNFKGHCTACDVPVYVEDYIFYEENEYKHQYHKKCFSCVTCKIQLDQRMKFLKVNDKIHCNACYQSNIVGNCTGCRLPITDTKILSVNGKNYHDKCFLCSLCRKELNGKYLGAGEKVYCETCHDTSVLTDCFKCKQKVVPDSNGKILSISFKNQVYHEGCFVCQTCNGPFVDGKVYSLNDKNTCSACKPVAVSK